MTQSTNGSRNERLLVVEDDPFSQELIALYLRKAGFEDITAATDGRQAVDLAKAAHYDLVLLDLNLPRISGTDVLRRLKKEGHLTNTPVVVISSLTNMEETVQCLDLGAEDYLPKPFNVRLLEGRVNDCLERHRLRREAEAAAAREERDRKAARALLGAMATASLPQPVPEFPCDCALRHDPAPTIGGDLVELFCTGDGRVAFLAATAAGEGVSATLAVARVRTLVRAAVEDAALTCDRPEPDAVLQRVNAALFADPQDGEPSGTVAALFGLFDPQVGTVQMANAGFSDALALGPARGVAPVSAPRGRPLGAYAEAVYTAHPFQVNAGETLLVLTDGFAETTDASAAQLGENRLRKRLDALLDAPPAQLIDALRKEAEDFAGTTPQSKDRSALALHRPRG
ncbi:PP2C family protein-serine/threonine phosphatase [Azospirillum canadense]|uniref:PP2C family protein-serine/threonine phosphatase n=1 Tax=Azospirillum canadense TaxID=403962 RepID=UPI0022272222|nr:SpoIIE family protein phosphatase [Azospirillum canadense]MCW2238728.1 sigma-B regulation protein RsbU (phosphoserine phosphatase) [Azospirillum canadense]